MDALDLWMNGLSNSKSPNQITIGDLWGAMRDFQQLMASYQFTQIGGITMPKAYLQSMSTPIDLHAWTADELHLDLRSRWRVDRLQAWLKEVDAGHLDCVLKIVPACFHVLQYSRESVMDVEIQLRWREDHWDAQYEGTPQQPDTPSDALVDRLAEQAHESGISYYSLARLCPAHEWKTHSRMTSNYLRRQMDDAPQLGGGVSKYHLSKFVLENENEEPVLQPTVRNQQYTNIDSLGKRN